MSKFSTLFCVLGLFLTRMFFWKNGSTLKTECVFIDIPWFPMNPPGFPRIPQDFPGFPRIPKDFRSKKRLCYVIDNHLERPSFLSKPRVSILVKKNMLGMGLIVYTHIYGRLLRNSKANKGQKKVQPVKKSYGWSKRPGFFLPLEIEEHKSWNTTGAWSQITWVLFLLSVLKPLWELRTVKVK